MNSEQFALTFIKVALWELLLFPVVVFLAAFIVTVQLNRIIAAIKESEKEGK